MENSDTTISTNFLEDLWPLILENNDCNINSSNTCEHFLPEKHFDHLWAHELLAKKCFANYKPAIELNCRTAEQLTIETKAEEEVDQLPYRGEQADILPLDQQLAILQQDVDRRKKLADDFANRTFPWYIQPSMHEHQFDITPDIEKLFKDESEFEILQSLQSFKCRLMIIDVAAAVPLEYMERWLKFASYATIITVIHDRDLYGKLKNFNYVFQPVWIEENTEATWQEQLEKSLNTGVEKAKELFLLDDMSQALAFVYSGSRDICVCNQFKILRKS